MLHQISKTLSFFFYFTLLFIGQNCLAQPSKQHFRVIQGAIVRGDSTKKEVAFVFTADEYSEGLSTIIQTLKKEKIKAGFFFTGRFYRNACFQLTIQQLNQHGHYLGPHSDNHLLYCDWTKRDSLLVTKDSFDLDINQNLAAIKSRGLPVSSTHYFIPPFEWWNDSIAAWSKSKGLKLVSFTPGIRTNADYTYPELGSTYKTTEWIINHLKTLASTSPNQLNGAIILIHAGTDPRRKDKLYNRLNEIILFLKKKAINSNALMN